ncbi:hypothetical protein OGM63_05705 [Plectonema radiosum NIES-515]|uniref:Uncharacterized protein n=1 Tax=Plectonema radiosum NIES-515 TaxID=2986073 RepID=A0ABT3AV77_9CYAN|nr:hypothetical protein [Plectonema radiosum]MCV3213026.1 hypothetical protein [Plectonema radiosum NIES-515]
MFEPQPNPFQANPPGFDFGFQEPELKSKTQFQNFNFDSGGQMTTPSKSAVPPGATPESINFDSTVRDYILKNQQLNEALKQQKAIDDLYKKVVSDALPREATVVPPDNFDLTAKPMKNITPPSDLEEIIKLKEQLLKKSQPTPKTPPPNPDLNLAPPSGTPGAKPGYKTIPNPGTVPNNTPEFRPNPKPHKYPVPNPLPKDLPPPPSPKGYFPPPADPPLPKPAKFPKAGLGGAAVGGLVDFGIRVASGQPPGQAAFGAAGGVVGGVVGGAIGSLGGPLGTFVGGVIGGAIGGAIADVVFPYFFPDPPSLDPPLTFPPFKNDYSAKNAYFINDQFLPIHIVSSVRTVHGKILSVQRLADSNNGYVKWTNYEVTSKLFEFVDGINIKVVSSEAVLASEPTPFLVGFVPIIIPNKDPEPAPAPSPSPSPSPSPTPTKKPLPFFPPIDMKLPDPGIPPEAKPPNICASDPCNLKISNDLDELKNKFEFVHIKVAVFKECNSKTGKPMFKEQTIKTIKGLEAQEILNFARIAKLEALQCENNCTATVPEWWQLRPEAQRPQLIYVFAEKKDDGTLGNDYYPMTIPHPKSDKPPEESPFQPYRKGSWEGILTLKDNSKVIINAFDKDGAESFLKEISKLINPKMLEGSFQKLGQRKGQKLKEITVQVIRADYYPEGSKDMKPKWVKNFRK